ncbi:MAG: hypothetical protein WBK19_11990 [Azonexus sp.]
MPILSLSSAGPENWRLLHGIGNFTVNRKKWPILKWPDTPRLMTLMLRFIVSCGQLQE